LYGVATTKEAGVTVKIPLRLSGVDLRHVEEYLRIPDEVAELGYEARGPISLAVVLSDEPNPAHEAAEWARRINKLFTGGTVTGVYNELVNIPDIAMRCEVAAEAVRLWASGKRRNKLRPFPDVADVAGFDAGGKPVSLYAWSDVVCWVREVLGTDPDEGVDYLPAWVVADLNAELAHLARDGALEQEGWSDLPDAAYRSPKAYAKPEPMPVSWGTWTDMFIERVDAVVKEAEWTPRNKIRDSAAGAKVRR
jgi:hypothetical protein